MVYTSFSSRVEKLEKNVYATVKGVIRLALLQQDVADFCPFFLLGKGNVLDVGGGSGRFARICAQLGHQVTLCDSSPEMLQLAEAECADESMSCLLTPLLADFLADNCSFECQYDLVAMHGSAEWMSEPERAIRKACDTIRPGGHLSLLMFNKDRNILKRGINGLLLQEDCNPQRNSLTPPGAMSPADIRLLLDSLSGTVLLQSGIRVFHKFFRQGVEESILSAEQWLQQEKLYYRKEPFSALGVHTHIIWQKSNHK